MRRPGRPWIAESIINEWIQKIRDARAANEQDIETEMRTLNLRGRMAVQWGLVGLGASMLVGLLGSVLLAHSMNRPLRELRRGIRDVSGAGLSEPIRVLSKDEFGELAGAFNDMAVRLKEEERMRSDFISMLSHEIRTPLTSIREVGESHCRRGHGDPLTSGKGAFSRLPAEKSSVFPIC